MTCDAGVLVGLEIHQQLDTGRKLFCSCTGTSEPGSIRRFARRLRPVKSEMGIYDPAALFEGAKDQTIMYHADSKNSCLVECDEEPPHTIDDESVRTALSIAAALRSDIFDELYTMRKTVIDGSNTSGFQRTMLVSRGGVMAVGDVQVGVQSICLEEDSARALSEGSDTKEYSLDRLGIPLVEIALDPISGTPRQVRKVAQHLGRLLRDTGRVARGIGSIRQDVNVSVRGGGGVVEIKGIQHLDQLEKAVEYETKRQAGLLVISKRMGPSHTMQAFDITGIMRKCNSKTVQKQLRSDHTITAILVRNLAGLLGYEPYPGIRLGREIAGMVKRYGIGGVFHTDELPAYGITTNDLDAIRAHTGAQDTDALVMVATPQPKSKPVTDAIMERIRQASMGVPAETRLAMADGTTMYMRPRPGSARMYPETDAPPVIISKERIAEAFRHMPKPWEERVAGVVSYYDINTQLASQILDSAYMDVFSDISNHTTVSPTFVASILCSTITSLGREGLDARLLRHDTLREIFALLDSGSISKESVEIILRDIMMGNSGTAREAMERTGTALASEDEVSGVLDDIISSRMDMVRRLREKAAGPLMGVAMGALRGRAPGQTVNRMLVLKINDILGG